MTINERIQKNQSLKTFCTFQIGGKADYFVEVNDASELVQALNWAQKNNHSVFIFGAGSNLLFDSEGYRGLVIRIKGSYPDSIDRVEADGGYVHLKAFAGEPIAMLTHAAIHFGLTGLEAWNGLPGTVGGAVFGNAGCFGVETKDILVSAEVWTPDSSNGALKQVGAEFFDYEYRHSGLREKLVNEDGTVQRSALECPVILSATFKLKKGEADEILAEMKRIALIRKGKQPPGLNTGSFFKNPDLFDKSTGWLIEQAGLKGFEMKNVNPENPMKVSEHHANFMMNTGGARSEHVLELSDLIIKRVEEFTAEKYGQENIITLKREVIFVPAKEK